MKLLYILNLANRVNSFCISSLEAAKSLGIEYHIASNWWYSSDIERESDERKYGVRIHQIDFIRSPFDLRNRKAYQQLRALAAREKFDAVHCNTPIGGLMGRILFKGMPGVKIIYQAHGFHFFKGAPKLNWLLFYPVEKWLARHTDAIVTINQEDYRLATNKFKPRNGGHIYYVPGVGVDTAQFSVDNTLRQNMREKLGIGGQSIVLISMGELNKNKNCDTAIRAVAAANNSNLHYLICGVGPEEANLKQLAENIGVSAQIHFLGFRSDIKELLCASDIFFFTTKREGLSRSMMEAMASGLPCVASSIRGNTDLLEGVNGGFLCKTNDVADYADKLNRLAGDPDLRKQMGDSNRAAVQKFDLETAIAAMKSVYESEFQEV